MVKSILLVVALRTCTLPSAYPSARRLPSGDQATAKMLEALCVVKKVVPRDRRLVCSETSDGTTRAEQAIKSREVMTKQPMTRNDLIARSVYIHFLFPL